jgi:hypothetical protein
MMTQNATPMSFTWTEHPSFGKGFDCFAEDAICRLGVAQWNGREAIRENLRAFINTGFTAL